MTKKLTLKFLDISGKIEEYEADVLICQTPLGEISILPNHHPLITIVNKGKIFFKNNNETKEVEVLENSILEVKNNIATITSLLHLTK